MLRRIILAFVLTGQCLAWAADHTGTITILEGDAIVYRGAGRVQVVEGLRLTPGDILETAASAFTQVELVDRSIVQFGPATRVMVQPGNSRAGSDRTLYLMSGWAKLSGVQRDAAAGPGFELRSPWVDVAAGSAVVVLRQSARALEAFVEAGEPRLGERQSGAASTPVPLKAGDFYARRAGERGVVSAPAPQAFVADVPRAFRDSLPARIERYRNAQVKPKDASDFAYADVEPWLKAEPAVRRPLMQRWRGKAREPAFRAALVTNLSAHPEWDPILFPEKYKPKEPPVRSIAGVARPASAVPTSATVP